jgi:hypothetical protein
MSCWALVPTDATLPCIIGSCFYFEFKKHFLILHCPALSNIHHSQLYDTLLIMIVYIMALMRDTLKHIDLPTLLGRLITECLLAA